MTEEKKLMKIYKVILEHERPDTSDKIERIEEYFTSKVIGAVFNVALTRAAAQGANIVGILEIAPNFTQLNT